MSILDQSEDIRAARSSQLPRMWIIVGLALSGWAFLGALFWLLTALLPV